MGVQLHLWRSVVETMTKIYGKVSCRIGQVDRRHQPWWPQTPQGPLWPSRSSPWDAST